MVSGSHGGRLTNLMLRNIVDSSRIYHSLLRFYSEKLWESSIHNWSSSGSDTNGTSLEYRHMCIWKPARHIVFIPRGKGYYSSRVNYYSNSDCSFHLTRLIISGDININPGPDKCSACNKSFARSHRMVDCDGCRGRYHFLCGGLTRRDLKAIQTGKRIWTCNKCILQELPLNTSFLSASSHSLNLSC